MPNPPPLDAKRRREVILTAGSFLDLLNEPGGEAVLEAEATDKALAENDRLITVDGLRLLRTLNERRNSPQTRLALLGSEDAYIIPGFLGSALRDTKGNRGLIWVGPRLLIDPNQIGSLRLDKFGGVPDHEADPSIQIATTGAVPAIYDLLATTLNTTGWNAEIVPFDWRKDLERSAVLLADKIRGRLGQKPRPLHIIAHSQGNLVARRAIQLLGDSQARQLVNSLVLLGPASFGTFASALALAGSKEEFDFARKFHVQFPDDVASVFQTFTGLYQLLPWKKDLFPNQELFPGTDPQKVFNPEDLFEASYWKTGIQKERLKYAGDWVKRLDSSFFNDRTAIILGDQDTTAAVRFESGELVPDGRKLRGDGTVPDFLAKIPGVRRTYRAPNASHMSLPLTPSVILAVRAILSGQAPSIDRVAFRADGDDVPSLRSPALPSAPKTSAKPQALAVKATLARAGSETDAESRRSKALTDLALARRNPPTPACRKLRVFSFDPLLATKLDKLDIARITIEVPWEDSQQLKEGPVGEYIEVVDYDPTSGCFYTPVDLTHPKLTAQDGLPPSESDPQFHQQMVYAVAMSTISTFEKALGRVALWAPRLKRDAEGEVVPTPAESQYVPRLRIYPHAIREANAYYDPDRHALLFGYFPSRETPGGETLPGGTVFAAQSFDIIAHETTHALLHGLHRYFFYPSNPDVLAFHEAFADVVALFQHFSHTDVVRHQVASVRGDLKKSNLLGELAWQFGQAMGKHRGALREYICREPDPLALQTIREPHDRGAILVAALFRAFQNIYEHRSRDLYRIATGGTGILPDGDIHPDLANRLAIEASKSAKHVLTMAVRALDYLPPVDPTYGEYLRALITADFDVVHDDDRGYRVAVIDAFRQWGIYPADVSVLDEPALLWDPPDLWDQAALLDVVRGLDLDGWKLRSNRRDTFLSMNQNIVALRKWLFQNSRDNGDDGNSFGIKLFGTSCQSIPRRLDSRDANGKLRPPLPKFEIHSIRPCLRIGPDGEPRSDIVVEIVQRRAGFFDPDVQETVDQSSTPFAFSPTDFARLQKEKIKCLPLPTRSGRPDFWFRGGCTLLIDPGRGEIRYCIRKSVRSLDRLDRQRAFEQGGGFGSTAAIYQKTLNRNPFAMLHDEE